MNWSRSGRKYSAEFGTFKLVVEPIGNQWLYSGFQGVFDAIVFQGRQVSRERAKAKVQKIIDERFTDHGVDRP